MLQKKLIISSLITAAVFPVSAFVSYAHAEEFTITGNGQDSSNSVAVSSQNQTTTQQTNTANVNNNTSDNTNTGNNSANNNNGAAAVTSGNAATTTNVTTDANHNQADVQNCNCTNSGTATVANNGANSSNNVIYSSNTTNVVNSTNTAHITTVTIGNVNTGNNHANNNLGDVSIKSGNINVKENIKTITGSNDVHLATGDQGIFSIDISGNGKGSVNNVTLTQNQNNIVTVSNVADILNLNIWNVITGNNKANDNHGNVSITSGDVNLALDIQNVANSNNVTVDCGCVTPPPPPPPCKENCGPVNPPSNPPSNTNPNTGPNVGSNPGPSVLAATTGPALPATGNPWILLAIIGNLLMLFFGAVLRLKSGRSPGFAFAF